ncbi:hypothetical protein KIN20_034286 [Parelaphostrongylus tenuis]|uniref:Uncharacterized protein n=1 Tax=Parelaphostrongylus tenuis TaxID=148309 RepID=A0AAD5RC73_PARTN|nr:hypothetical protein KIN20_034286 [Parelaphostrongylus tenuis]
MNVRTTMARLLTDLFMILLLTTLSTVFGCGVMPAGQRSTRTFTVTGFSLLVAMVYSTAADAPTRFPGIATSEAVAKGFVERLVMQTVFDVLESQARSALLPDAVISVILSQLTVTVNYTPLMCAKVHLGIDDRTTMLASKEMEKGCIIVSSTVTGICTNSDANAMKPCNPADQMIKITAVSGAPLKISGSLSTTNIILANWSRTMWQSMVNRAARMLASGPFRTHFFSAIATVDGNYE